MALPPIGSFLGGAQDKRRDSFVDMNFTVMLNTNRMAVLGRHNMQYDVAVPVTMNHDVSGPPHYAQQNLYVPNGNPRVKSENGSERGMSPHHSDPSSRYNSQTPQQQIPNYAHIATQLASSMARYPSPNSHMTSTPQMQAVASNMNLLQQSFHPHAPQDQGYGQHTPLGAVHTPGQNDQSPLENGRSSGGNAGLPKAFACSTCAKGFARRSDLARHERIHSGVRPHVCEHPGCGKQFIQRSALTVHSRVHTGEKPHMCERCGKPFSDSSSLARHRRIHSGKRPYKCPYADCQKTFTRRTTLTRHQNHHTGTIEESEAATAAALASRSALGVGRSSRGSDEENEYSDTKSPLLQHNDRPMSVSPANGMNGMPALSRQPSDYYLNAMTGGMAAVPPHIRTEMQPTSRPQSPAQYQMPVAAQAQRSGMTSNPAAAYNPPQILEPPTANGQQSANGGNSPHMGGPMGWQSPHNGLQPTAPGEFAYPDPNQQYANVNAAQMYYQQQRPHSTGPLDYHNQLRSQEMWAQHQQ